MLAAHRVGDRERDGLQGAPRAGLVVGEERHSTIDRSLRYLGFWRVALEVVEADAQGAMRPAALAARLFSGADGPTIVCAQAGNVNWAAFDPFDEIWRHRTRSPQASGCASTARSGLFRW